MTPATAASRSRGTTTIANRETSSNNTDCDTTPVTDAAIPDDATLAAMAKALGHPARVRILRLLADRATCITGDLVAEFPLAQSTVSEHLKILREAGLVQGEIDGPRTHYCISPAGLAALKSGIASL